jgi:hypothetical protein
MAIRQTNGLNPTPWTTPVTRMRFRTLVSAGMQNPLQCQRTQTDRLMVKMHMRTQSDGNCLTVNCRSVNMRTAEDRQVDQICLDFARQQNTFLTRYAEQGWRGFDVNYEHSDRSS